MDIDGSPDSNAIEVSQNAPDDNSPLTCKPDCPQKDYDESENDYNQEDGGSAHENTETREFVQYDHPGEGDASFENVQESFADQDPDTVSGDYPEQDLPDLSRPEEPVHDSPVTPTLSSSKPCPGSNIDECIDVCPYAPPLAYRYCVAECGRRCP